MPPNNALVCRRTRYTKIRRCLSYRTPKPYEVSNCQPLLRESNTVQGFPRSAAIAQLRLRWRTMESTTFTQRLLLEGDSLINFRLQSRIKISAEISSEIFAMANRFAVIIYFPANLLLENSYKINNSVILP